MLSTANSGTVKRMRMPPFRSGESQEHVSWNAGISGYINSGRRDLNRVSMHCFLRQSLPVRHTAGDRTGQPNSAARAHVGVSGGCGQEGATLGVLVLDTR